MSARARMKVGVLVSGSGSNLQALLDAAKDSSYPAEVALVISNVPGVKALERARAANVKAEVVGHKDFSTRGDFEKALVAMLKQAEVETVCLAGFMRLLGKDFLSAFPNRVLNVHPALLPSFPGTHAPRQALEAGVKVAGCTVHFVDEGTDTGPIIAQAAVPLLSTDDEASLTARIQKQEHRLYPRVLESLARGEIALAGRRAVLQVANSSSESTLSAPV